MRLEIDIAEHHYNNIMALDSVSLGRAPYKGIIMYSINAIKHGKVLEQEPTTENDSDVQKAIEIIKADSLAPYSVNEILEARDLAVEALKQMTTTKNDIGAQMTNGEKMISAFPNGEVRKCEKGVVFSTGGWCHAYAEEWWNAECEEPTTRNGLGVDCISREQALVAIRNLYPGMPRVDFNGSLRKWVDKYKPYIECDDAIKQLPSVTPQPRWIPVSERLPENHNQEVLMSLEWGIDIGRYSDGEWHSEWINHYDDGNVLAWMPLPQPYREIEE